MNRSSLVAMTPTSNQATYTASSHWGSGARNFHTSARLHLQHLLFQNTLGTSLLEPRIEQSLSPCPEIRVADLGCGNGAWLLDLHHALSRSESNCKKGFRLQGFDINPKNFPNSTFIPDSITLSNLDVLSRPLPAELRSAFDIVHVRAFVSIIRHGDIGPLLDTICELLKPGGWFLWEESRADRFVARSPSSSISKEACDSIIRIMDAGGKASGYEFSFLASLSVPIAHHGFDDVDVRYVNKRTSDLKAWTENYLLVWEELTSLFPSRHDIPEAAMTKEAFGELFGKAVAETESGVVVHQEQIAVASGRKPL
jgi:SAM-dependent methyltransferase